MSTDSFMAFWPTSSIAGASGANTCAPCASWRRFRRIRKDIGWRDNAMARGRIRGLWATF